MPKIGVINIAKEFSISFYKSKAWLDCRDGYIQSAHGLCERCLDKGIVKPGYIVHHKELLTPENINNPYVTLNWDKLEYVCQDCHNKEHHGNDHEVVREGLTFDEKGELVEVKG